MQDSYVLQPETAVAVTFVMGLAGGWLFHTIWRRIMPRTRSRAFWEALPRDVRGMLESDEPQELVRCYRSLLGALAGFAGRNTLAVAAGLVPVALGYLFVERLGVAEYVDAKLEQPLGRWMSAFEFWFCVAVVAGSALAAWAARRAKVDGA